MSLEEARKIANFETDSLDIARAHANSELVLGDTGISKWVDAEFVKLLHR